MPSMWNVTLSQFLSRVIFIHILRWMLRPSIYDITSLTNSKRLECLPIIYPTNYLDDRDPPYQGGGICGKKAIASTRNCLPFGYHNETTLIIDHHFMAMRDPGIGLQQYLRDIRSALLQEVELV